MERTSSRRLSRARRSSGGGVPSHSRAFDLHSRWDGDGGLQPEEGFFVPTYLLGSTYAQKLDRAHRSRILSHRELLSRAAENGHGKNLGPPEKAALPPGSHRGLSHTVIERPSGFEEEEADDQNVAPLPSKWNKDDIWGGIEVLADGLSLRYTGPKNIHERDHEASAVRADHPMPLQCGVYYYEVHMLHGKRDDLTIAIGFSSSTSSLSRPIGWEPESWGFHGDDGRAFHDHNSGRVFATRFNPGDVIGCGMNFHDRSVFFTKNGVHLGTAFDGIHTAAARFYPSISLKQPGEHVRANFGQSAFVYNIEDMMREHRERVQKEIRRSDTSKLADMSETDFIQTLVLQFLQHDGYVETAEAFAGETRAQKMALNQRSSQAEEESSLQDDENAHKRQRIRKAILDGDISQALRLTNSYYPKVLRDNETVHFKLQRRHFIEIVRRTAEISSAPADAATKKNGWSSENNENMEVDVHGADGGRDDEDLRQLEQDMLEYGQQLQDQYASHPSKEIQSSLRDIWGLLAYCDPLQEPQVNHMLDKKGRVAVSEELNSAILLSLGKSSRAKLETLYAGTSVLLEELQNHGGDGAFVSISDVVDSIEKC